MLVTGVILLFVFAAWDFGYASRPVIPPRFIKNKTIVIAASVGFIDFVSPCACSILQLWTKDHLL